MNKKPQPFDVVSSGTLRDSDLLEAMLDTLEYYRPRKYKELIQNGRQIEQFFGDFGYVGYFESIEQIDSRLDYEDSKKFKQWTKHNKLENIEQIQDYIVWVIQEDLWDAMQDISPANCSFCSHFGDGALFGFWPYEDSPLWE